MNYKIQIISAGEDVKAEREGEEQVVFVWEGEYKIGDRIMFQVPEKDQFYIIRVDDTMEESFVYLTKQTIQYEIPFGEKKSSYNPKAFEGTRHYLTVRMAKKSEICSYHNLAKNVMDQHEEHGCYPHASANVETRGEAVFAARNAIDGIVANDSHGNWPFESWGINRQDDAEFMLEFGRPVDMDKIILYTRADFPHDNWWEEVTFIFSDGTSESISLQKSEKPHEISLKKRDITWLKLCQLKKSDDPSPFPALTQIEVYGTEAM